MSSVDFKQYNALGPLIRDYRKWRRLSQEAFADSISVSVRQLRRWEAGLSHAGHENLQDIAALTGIPMEVCIALNAGHPLWYSLPKRRFAYTLIEAKLIKVKDLLQTSRQGNEGILTNNDRVISDEYIAEILSCHSDTYGSKRSIDRNTIRRAAKLMPDLNRVVLDNWGHVVGHVVCLPLSFDTYESLKKQTTLEDFLTPDNISNIQLLKRGVFFHYSIFSTSLSVAYPMIVSNARYLSKIANKRRYLAAFHAATEAGKEFFDDLNMRTVWRADSQGNKHPEGVPLIQEIELNSMIERISDYASIGPELEDHTDPRFSLSVDKSLRVDELKDRQTQNLLEPCPNPGCHFYGKSDKGNIVCNGTYCTKEGNLRHRYICKACGTSFCDKAGTIFYGLRSPEEKILAALRHLSGGKSIEDVAGLMKVKIATIRRWLQLTARQEGNIATSLAKELDISLVQLRKLWFLANSNPRSQP